MWVLYKDIQFTIKAAICYLKGSRHFSLASFWMSYNSMYCLFRPAFNSYVPPSVKPVVHDEDEIWTTTNTDWYLEWAINMESEDSSQHVIWIFVSHCIFNGQQTQLKLSFSSGCSHCFDATVSSSGRRTNMPLCWAIKQMIQYDQTAHVGALLK